MAGGRGTAGIGVHDDELGYGEVGTVRGWVDLLVLLAE